MPLSVNNLLMYVVHFIWLNFSLMLLSAYMSSPCHIELTLSEKEEAVKKEVRFRFILFVNLYLGVLLISYVVLLLQ